MKFLSTLIEATQDRGTDQGSADMVWAHIPPQDTTSAENKMMQRLLRRNPRKEALSGGG